MKKDSTIQVGPIDVDDLSADEIVEEILKSSGKVRMIFNLNANALNLAFKYPDFCECLRRADICFCDGFGVKILSAIFSQKMLRHRNTPPDFVDILYEQLYEKKKTVYFLGDKEEVVSRYVAMVEKKFPGIVSGYHHGFFDSSQESEILREIQKVKPRVLILGMGMPRQEMWVCKHDKDLPVDSALAVGALFAWASDSRRKRGPRWATDMGMEWLFRLFYEFGNVWKRYLIGLPEVFLRVLSYFIKKSF